MVILTQKGTKIINYDKKCDSIKSEQWFHDGDHIIALYKNNDLKNYTTLGEYKTLEKAKSVITEILRDVRNEKTTFEMP